MRRVAFLVLVLALSAGLPAALAGSKDGFEYPETVTVDVVDVLLREQIEVVSGKRLGLVTNPSGVEKELRASVPAYFAAGGAALDECRGAETGELAWRKRHRLRVRGDRFSDRGRGHSAAGSTRGECRRR